MSDDKKKVPKKIYVDQEKYERLKTILDIMNMSITDFFDEAMTNYIESLENAVINQDKELFLQMMQKNLEVIQNQLEEELKK